MAAPRAQSGPRRPAGCSLPPHGAQATRGLAGGHPLPPPEHTSRVQLQGELSLGTALESICLLVCLRAKPVLEWG